jgi:hypothetical protein
MLTLPPNISMRDLSAAKQPSLLHAELIVGEHASVAEFGHSPQFVGDTCYWSRRRARRSFMSGSRDRDRLGTRR